MQFIHTFQASGKKHDGPTVLVLHGMGGDEQSLLPFAHAVAPQANVLSIRGDVIENGKTRFYKTGFMPDDIEQRTNDLQAFIQDASSQYQFNTRNLYALGWSNGANMASLLLFYRPLLLKGAILFRTLVPPAPSSLPDLSHASVLISGGREDEIDPPEESEKLSELLSSAHAEVAFRWDNGGHNLTKSDEEAAHEWWNRKILNSQ